MQSFFCDFSQTMAIAPLPPPNDNGIPLILKTGIVSAIFKVPKLS
jgi:hypothetical protein